MSRQRLPTLPSHYRKVVSRARSPDGTRVFTEGSWREVTAIIEVPFPSSDSLRDDEVVVRVAYAGVQASDCVQALAGYGPLAHSPPPPTPTSAVDVGDLGCEMVGEIVDIGSAAPSYLKLGGAVMASGIGVGFREFAVCKASDLMPVRSARPEYVAVLVSGTTADLGLEMAGHISPSDVVMITAAAGGTGQFAVQLAKQLGCTVVATCSSDDKRATLMQIGADVVINYRTENVDQVLKERFPRGVDLVYECVGGPITRTCWNNLAPFGRLVIIGLVGNDYTRAHSTADHFDLNLGEALFRSKSIGGFFLGDAIAKHPDRYVASLQKITKLIDSNSINVVLEKRESFVGVDGVQSAQEFMRTGANVGKIFIQIASPLNTPKL